MTEIGPNLLGRIPSPPDERDFRLAPFLLDSGDPLVAALQALEKSRAARTTKDWAAIATPLIRQAVPWVPPAPTPDPTPTPTPDPTPAPDPTAAVSWSNSNPILDQGQTGHCVGFGGAQWGNTLPVDDHLTNDDGHAIYYSCKIVDNEPQQENGSTVRSLAKVLRQRNRVAAYAFANSVDEMVAWIMAKGPVVVGTDWTNGMFTPDASGMVRPTGAIAGGHCYLATGFDPQTSKITFLNSWGAHWANGGYFTMVKRDFTTLFANQGEAMVAVELP